MDWIFGLFILSVAGFVMFTLISILVWMLGHNDTGKEDEGDNE